jgi:carbonic anhydrase
MTDLGPRPRKKLAVLACMDARMDVFSLLDLERGDAHIVRNAGGLVTDDVLRSLSASQRLLGTEEVVVIMHRDCGIEGRPEYGGFEDVEEALREGLERLRSAPELVARDRVRGLIYDPSSGELESLEDPG